MRIARFFLVAFLLNLAWELCHGRLYGVSSMPFHAYARLMFGAAILDALVLALLVLALGGNRWLADPGQAGWTTYLFSALGIAFLTEAVALRLGLWSYLPAMPTLFGIGLTPLLQLPLTGGAALAFSTSSTGRRYLGR